MACTATSTALLSSPNPSTRASSNISPKSSLSTKPFSQTLSIIPTSFNGLRKPFRSQLPPSFISSPRSHSHRSFLVRAGELPLVGNTAPDFEAEAVFDQEFIKVVHEKNSVVNKKTNYEALLVLSYANMYFLHIIVSGFKIGSTLSEDLIVGDPFE